MTENKLNGLRVAILVTDGFEQVELVEPRKALDAAGAKTFIVAPKSGKIQGFNHDTKADSFEVDMTLETANPDSFDAVLLPGGALNADALRVETKAKEFIMAINNARKPIAFICHAPWLLVSAGLVQGRKMTSYHTIQDDIRNAGGQWQDTEVIVDANWVSSRQPSDIPSFNEAMIKLFGENHEQPMANSIITKATDQDAYTMSTHNISIGQDEHLINHANRPDRHQNSTPTGSGTSFNSNTGSELVSPDTNGIIVNGD